MHSSGVSLTYYLILTMKPPLLIHDVRDWLSIVSSFFPFKFATSFISSVVCKTYSFAIFGQVLARANCKCAYRVLAFYFFFWQTFYSFHFLFLRLVANVSIHPISDISRKFSTILYLVR